MLVEVSAANEAGNCLLHGVASPRHSMRSYSGEAISNVRVLTLRFPSDVEILLADKEESTFGRLASLGRSPSHTSDGRVQLSGLAAVLPDHPTALVDSARNVGVPCLCVP
jgi:hypothetical protein